MPIAIRDIDIYTGNKCLRESESGGSPQKSIMEEGEGFG